MRKRKDGKVVASLTEVKNKTGDIFALVDQYGEVTLTSYNKEKYKIVKIDLSDMLDHEEQEEKPEPKVEAKEEPAKKVEEEKETVVETPAPEVKVEAKAIVEPTVVVPDNIVETKTEEVVEEKQVVEEVKEEPKEEVAEAETSMASEEDDMTDIIPWDENSELEQMHVQEITAALQ